jgi:hypothetical protein
LESSYKTIIKKNQLPITIKKQQQKITQYSKQAKLVINENFRTNRGYFQKVFQNAINSKLDYKIISVCLKK